MLNIKEEVEICLLRKGLSMRQTAKLLRERGCDVPLGSGLSTQFRNKRVKFQTVSEILDFLGYELIIKEKDNH